MAGLPKAAAAEYLARMPDADHDKLVEEYRKRVEASMKLVKAL
ncbi:hypothetical protein [Azospirillum soli]|nr:hypothetical protein [Azospirillum soli]MBP2311866.1 hypothetical protein [Azospirillum soli]